jgi:hypothetical protein
MAPNKIRSHASWNDSTQTWIIIFWISSFRNFRSDDKVFKDQQYRRQADDLYDWYVTTGASFNTDRMAFNAQMAQQLTNQLNGGPISDVEHADAALRRRWLCYCRGSEE